MSPLCKGGPVALLNVLPHYGFSEDAGQEDLAAHPSHTEELLPAVPSLHSILPCPLPLGHPSALRDSFCFMDKLVCVML